mgnify:CR=1 FL=1
MQKIDSLWMGLQETKGLFGYKMDEFIVRKTQMQANLTKLKFVDGQKINEENIANVQQYNAMFRIYRGIGQQYKDAVLGAEAIFYEIKGLETEVKKGGIIIPDTAKEKPQEGEVVAVGTGKRDENGKHIDFVVKKGDKVLISKYGGTEVKLDGVAHLIMREDDILGIIG